MTKKIVAVLALSLVSVSAFASQAKNLVTGTGDAGSILGGSGMNGSFYTSDEYNLFWNPAFINGMKSWAIMENDSTGGPSGGFVTGMGAYNLGVFLNRPGTTNGSRAIDLVLGGDKGMNWGAALTRTLSEGEATTTVLKVGAMVGEFEPFLHYTLNDSNGASGAAENSNAGMTIGTRYHWGDWTPYAAYKTTTATVAGTEGDAVTNMGLGFGRSGKMGDVSVDYAISYWRQNSGDISVLPLNMTFSGAASSWLTLRGGFSHDIMARGTAGATTTRVGASVNMGKADLDMAVANTADGMTLGGEVLGNLGLTYRM